ncbi:uncharacterized protein LOC109015083 [Juglans regia]|nr:uncharacterized protein LOC109015083 [Juglans regia]
MCLSWNCRGLGNPRTVRELHRIVKCKNPSLIFLIETKCGRETVEKARNRLGFDSSFVVDNRGLSGGVAFIWKDDLDVTLDTYSQNHISLLIKDGIAKMKWLLTGFYGSLCTSGRKHSWRLLRALKPVSPIAWLCIGDFNEIMLANEKWGAADRPYGQMEDFCEALNDCGLSDLGYKGDKFTWSNRREGVQFTKERLDRALGNAHWFEVWKAYSVGVEPVHSSDHRPILVSWNTKDTMLFKRDRPFRYEAKWAVREGCDERRLNSKLKQLDTLQSANTGNLGEELRRIQGDIDQLLKEEDTSWKQRAKPKWLKDGDRNSKFFHQCANQRRKTNTITCLKDNKGKEASSQEEIAAQFQVFFKSLFSTSCPVGIEECIGGVEARINSDMVSHLSKRFTEKEVEEAIFQMSPISSPGPDGFPPIFYKQHWISVGKEVCEAALFVLNSGGSLQNLNDTYIVLIPKVKEPKLVTDFRPISLCNVMYKIISKTMANRLKLILPEIISPTQSAFIPGRLISDNVIVAFEALHTMNNRLQGKIGHMALKLDMSKAYDRIEWPFIQAVLSKMGFPEKWIKMIMNCVETVSYSLLVNGSPQQSFSPSRGIRQGDPLSPYLFILCAEVLSNLLNLAEARGVISGIPIAKGQLHINHLFFADDSLLFCKSNAIEMCRLLDILSIYEKASGQRLNKEKTSIHFSRNTPQLAQSLILQIAGVRSSTSYEQYLGLPALMGRSRVGSFNSILDRMKRRIGNFKVKTLSQAGKEILLKAVVQALPTYCMGVFKLPGALIKKMNSIMHNFWWGQQDKERKVHWVSWNIMGRTKSEGGLGFRDIESVNLAMLAKQAWRIIQHPLSLVSRVLKLKYFPHSTFGEAKVGHRPSYIWRSVLATKSLIEKGSIWRVGNGCNIKIWVDKWLPQTASGKVESARQDSDIQARVSSLIDPDTKTWNLPQIEEVLGEEEAKLIIQIPLNASHILDKLIWRSATDGLFTVRRAYHLHKELRAQAQGQSSNREQLSEEWKVLWKLNVLPATKNFLWKACRNGLPTLSNLYKKRITEKPWCPICLNEEETVFHMAWNCPATQDVWGQCSRILQKRFFPLMSFRELWNLICQVADMKVLEEFATVSRLIWNRRNKFIFQQVFLHPNEVIRQASEALIEMETCRITRSIQPKEDQKERWTPPPEFLFKMNWDASVDKFRGRIGIGVIIRDHKGLMIAALRMSRPLYPDPTLAEACGAYEATKFGLQLRLSKVVLEGDSQQIVSALLTKDKNDSHRDMVTLETQKLLSLYEVWSVKHVVRKANRVAHVLARKALFSSEAIVDIEDPPLCISDLLLNE